MGWDVVLASAFGVVFITTSLVLAVRFPSPTHFQLLVFRTTLALSAGGVAAAIPGFLNLSLDFTGVMIRAGGALAIFLLVYRFNPAHMVIDTTPNSSEGIDKAISDLGSHSGELVYEDGRKEEMKPTHSDGVPIYPLPRITINRIHDYEHRINQQTQNLLDLTRIDIQTNDCLWFKLPQISEIDGIHMREDFEDKELSQLYQLPKHFFHQASRKADDHRIKKIAS